MLLRKILNKSKNVEESELLFDVLCLVRVIFIYSNIYVILALGLKIICKNVLRLYISILN